MDTPGFTDRLIPNICHRADRSVVQAETRFVREYLVCTFLWDRYILFHLLFVKLRLVSVRFLQKYWSWLGYSFILFITNFFRVMYKLNCLISSEQLLVLIEYVPFGDLLGYLRKSRGLKDTYYKDPDIKPQTNLTSQQLMKFAWQIADGMSYLSSKSVG